MKATELLDLLREFYRDKLTMRQRHVAAARLVSDYDFNNTYQYVIAREDLQLNWLRDAVTDMGGAAARRRRSRRSQTPAARAPQVAGVDARAQDRDGAQAFRRQVAAARRRR